VCGFLRIDNYIDGSEFVNITPPEVKEMVSPIGLAKKIIRLIPKVGGWVVLGLTVIGTFNFSFFSYVSGCFCYSQRN